MLACLVLCAITLLAYSNSFRSGFVFDSQPLILEDPRLRQATANNLALILQHTYWWPKAETGLYRPITTLSYLFNYSVLGESNHPAGYHWFNFFLHCLNAVLLFALALRVVKKLWPSAWIAGLWAVHPVLTESVTNIIGRSDLLAAACVTSGFLFYLNSTETNGWRRLAWLAGLTAVTTIGAFSKESAVAILGVIVLFELTWWKERRQSRSMLLGCAAIAPALMVLFYQRLLVLSHSLSPQMIFVDNPLIGAHYVRARLTAMAIMARYLWLLVWPARLSCDYSYAAIPLARGGLWDWIDWLALIAVMAVAAWQFTRNKLACFFAAFAFVTFLPVSNLLFSIGTIMAERLLYLPAMGFAICLVLAVCSLAERVGSRKAAPVLLGLVLLAFSVRTWKRNLDWQDDISLWTSAVHTVPASFKGHGALALALYQSDPTHAHMDRVLEEAEKSLAILEPLPDALNYGKMYADVGLYYMVQSSILAQPGADGRPGDSAASLTAAERAQRLLKRGASIEETVDRAFRERERARGKPDSQIPLTGSGALYSNLAENSMRLGDRGTAWDAAQEARLLNSENLANYQILSKILVSQDRKEDAAVQLIEGIMVAGPQAPGFMQGLRELYGEGVDPKGCAIVYEARGEALNNLCEPVHEEICKASVELVATYQKQLRGKLADQARQRALGLGCPPGQLN